MSAAHKLYSQSNAGLHVSAELTNPSSGLLSKTNSKEMQWHVTMSTFHHVNMSTLFWHADTVTCHHVNMSNDGDMLTWWHVTMSICQHDGDMSPCQHFTMSICQNDFDMLTCWHVTMSTFHHVNMSLHFLAVCLT